MLQAMKKTIYKVPMLFVIWIMTLVVVGFENINIFGGLEVNSYDDPFLTDLIIFLSATFIITVKWVLVISCVYYLIKHICLRFSAYIKQVLN